MNENQLLTDILAQVKRVFGTTTGSVSYPLNENQLLFLILERFKELAA